MKASTLLQALRARPLESLTLLTAAALTMTALLWVGNSKGVETPDPTSPPAMARPVTGAARSIRSEFLGIANAQLPFGTPVTASASGGNQTNTATLAGVAGKTTWLSGFTVTAAGATAALDVNVTVTGCTGGTLTYAYTFPIGVTVGSSPLTVNFIPAVPASGQNQAIAVSLPAGGAGNTNAAVVAWGAQE